MSSNPEHIGHESEVDLDELVASSDTGGRNPSNPSIAKLLTGVALAWSLFQLWIASPLPFIIGYLPLLVHFAQRIYSYFTIRYLTAQVIRTQLIF